MTLQAIVRPLWLALGALAGTVAGAAEDPILNVYNWADYIGATTLAQFEGEFGIKVNYDVYDSSEIVDAKLLAGATGYDVVIHSAALAARLIPIHVFQPLDRAKLANWHHLDAELLSFLGQFDPGNRYGAPYMWGSTGFAYNVDMVRARMPDAPLDSGAMIFDPAVASRFADCGISFLDSPTDVIPLALAYLGHDVSSVESGDLAEAEALLKRVRPYVRYFDSTKVLLDLPSREICIAMSWSGDYATATARAREAGIDIDLAYTIPREGATAWFDVALIPSDARHPDNAHKFIDFLLRPEVIAAITNETHYANANRSASALIDPDIAADPAVYPGPALRAQLHATKVLPPKAERLRTRTWARIKSGL
ncbi:MAG: polyamine ABC transporter substrate-binding protein [Gammaproteobacteria bacterium]|nr:polyamine ABC transporter substrate-binding protein [Gammaproteobacteria bacterium]